MYIYMYIYIIQDVPAGAVVHTRRRRDQEEAQRRHQRLLHEPGKDRR